MTTTRTTYTGRCADDTAIKELAAVIAHHAEAIAAGTTSRDVHAIAVLLRDNTETLAVWTEQS